MITIGQSPRDDILSVMRKYVQTDVEIVQRGALDGLDASTVAGLRPEPGQTTLVSRLRDGTEAKLAHERIVPLMQKGVDDLAQEGVEFIVLLCSGAFAELHSERPILHPSRLVRGVVTALVNGSRLGVVVPSVDQVAGAETSADQRWGTPDVFVTHASPYAEPAVQAGEWRRVARELKNEGVDLACLNCMGMDEEMKATVQRLTRKPVILASSLVGRIVGELVGGRHVRPTALHMR